MIWAGVPLEHTFRVNSEKLTALLLTPEEISIPFSCCLMAIPEPAKGFVDSILLISLLKNSLVKIDTPCNSFI